MPQKTWVAGEEVIASDFNTYVQRQVVATFASTAERNTAIPAPTVGMTCTVNGQFQVYAAGAWRDYATALDLAVDKQPKRYTVNGTGGTSGGTFANIQSFTIPAQPVAGSVLMWSFLRLDIASLTGAYLVHLRTVAIELATMRLAVASSVNTFTLSASYPVAASTTLNVNVTGVGTAGVTTYTGPALNRLDMLWVAD